MRYEDYAQRGYKAVDYAKLSQWQRWRGLRLAIYRGTLNSRPEFVWCFQRIAWDGEPPYRAYKPWQGWRWGIWQEQMYSAIGLGPLRLYFDFK